MPKRPGLSTKAISDDARSGAFWRSALLATVVAVMMAPVAAESGPDLRAAAAPGARPTGPQVFNSACASCHGSTLSQAAAPNLFSDRLLSLSDERLQARISAAHRAKDGPNIKDLYTDGQIFQIAAYLRLQRANLQGKPPFIADPDGQIVKTRKQTFRVSVITRGLDTPGPWPSCRTADCW